MPVIVILIVVGLFFWIQLWVYKKNWSRHLTASVDFKDHYLYEGAGTQVTETLSNRKFLPLPWVQVKFEIFRNGATCNLFKSDVYNILFQQKITRQSRQTFAKRGVYTVSSMDLISYDLFISTKFVRHIPARAVITVYPKPVDRDLVEILYRRLMGTLTTRRYTLEDPFIFKGIREYRDGDSFRDINFAASAKNMVGSGGEWLVNTHEYTVDQSVHILLLTDKATDYFDENEYESALRLAASFTTMLEEDQIPVSFDTNGLDSLEGTQPGAAAGASPQHINSVLDLLARLDVTKTGDAGPGKIKDLTGSRLEDQYFLIIAPDHSKDMLEAYQQLRQYTDACLYLSPTSYRALYGAEDKEKNLPDTVDDFYYFEV